MYAKAARYRDLRPENVDSNLFNYHRKMMMKDGYIRRNSDGLYELSDKGLQFVERASVETMKVRSRPKLSVTFLLLDRNGKIAVWKKPVQPFIDTLNLPNGKIRFEDTNTLEAARRLLTKFYSDETATLQFRGVAEVVVSHSDVALSHTYSMIVVAHIDPTYVTNELIEWIMPNFLLKQETTPGAVEIVKDYLGAEYFQYKNYHLTI